jgi:hypothetical protein
MFRIGMLFLALCGSAAAVEIHLDADNKKFQEGETVGLYLSIVDGLAQGTPRLPIVDGLSIVSRGRRQSMVSINGQPTRTTTYTYALTGLKAGEYDVPAFVINVRGQAYNTQPIHLIVSPRAKDLQGGVQAGFNQEKMWVGQTVVYHLSLRVPGQILQSRWTPPIMEGFTPEQSVSPSQREYNTQLDGQSWGVLELATPLIATSAGVREVPPGLVQVELPAKTRRRISLFSESRSEAFPTAPVPVAVYPLPAEGRGAHFSGLVGDFTLSVALSKNRLAAGESTTLTVRIEGDGSLAGFILPPLLEQPGFVAYDDEPSFQGRIEDGRFFGAALLKRAIVPEKQGRYTLPPIQIQTFSPATGEYELLEGPRFQIEVVGGDGMAEVDLYGDERLIVQSQVVEDILPIRPNVATSNQRFGFSALMLGVGVAPWAMLLMLGLVERARSMERNHDPKRELLHRIRGAGRLSIGELESLFRDCAGFAIGQAPAGLCRQDLERELSGPLQVQAVAIYQSFEAARFGGGAVVESPVVQECMRKLVSSL